jgi:hypothetical protein
MPPEGDYLLGLPLRMREQLVRFRRRAGYRAGDTLALIQISVGIVAQTKAVFGGATLVARKW